MAARPTTLLRAHAAQQRGTIENDKIFKGMPLAGAWRSNERPAVLSEGRRRKRNSDWPHSKSQHMRAHRHLASPKNVSFLLIAGKHTASSKALPAGRLRPSAARQMGQNLAGGLREAKADDAQRLTISGGDLYRAHIKTTQRDAWSCVKYRAFHVVGRMTSGIG